MCNVFLTYQSTWSLNVEMEKNPHWISCLKHAYTYSHGRTWLTNSVNYLLGNVSNSDTISHTHAKSTEYWHVYVSVRACMDVMGDKATNSEKNHTKKRKHIEFHSIGSFDGNSKKHSARGAIHRYFWAVHNTSAFEMFTCTISIDFFQKKSTSNYFSMLIFSHCHCPSVQYMSINFIWRRRRKKNKQTNKLFRQSFSMRRTHISHCSLCGLYFLNFLTFASHHYMWCMNAWWWFYLVIIFTKFA